MEQELFQAFEDGNVNKANEIQQSGPVDINCRSITLQTSFKLFDSHFFFIQFQSSIIDGIQYQYFI